MVHDEVRLSSFSLAVTASTMSNRAYDRPLVRPFFKDSYSKRE